MNKIPLQPGLESWKPTNSGHIANWLGEEKANDLSAQMKDFYWPIAVDGVPGRVYAMPGGDFCGKILAGSEVSAYDRASDAVTRERRRHQILMANRINRPRFRRQQGAFASISALLAAATGGKGQYLTFTKTGVAPNAIGNLVDHWTDLTSFPVAGGAAGAAPGGTAFTNLSQGALPFVNPANANTSHFVKGEVSASVVNNTLLLYDRLFGVAKTMNSTANEAVTGTFARYQGTNSLASNYAGGNFCFPSNPTTVLAGTAHNWTAGGGSGVGCTYTNQAGTPNANFVVTTGVSGCVLRGVDIVAGQWFMQLAAGDVGIQALSNMACSALVASGTIDFVVGHPIAFMPCPIANFVCVTDGLYTAFNLVTIFDNACLSFLEMMKAAASAATFNGMITVVAE